MSEPDDFDDVVRRYLDRGAGLIYLLVPRGDPDAMQGWAVPPGRQAYQGVRMTGP